MHLFPELYTIVNMNVLFPSVCDMYSVRVACTDVSYFVH